MVIYSVSTTPKICAAFGNDTLSDTTTQKYFEKFSLEELSLTDEDLKISL